MKLLVYEKDKAEKRFKYLTNWHPFFCLWPRYVYDYQNDKGYCVCLQWVERKIWYNNVHTTKLYKLKQYGD